MTPRVMQPWANTPAVKTLDAQLEAGRLTPITCTTPLLNRAPPDRPATIIEERENTMGGQQEKKDDREKYEQNGHDPDWEPSPEDPGGKHEKKDDDPEKK